MVVEILFCGVVVGMLALGEGEIGFAFEGGMGATAAAATAPADGFGVGFDYVGGFEVELLGGC